MDIKNKIEKLVLDLETKKGFSEVKGRDLKQLGVSVVGIYSFQDNEFKVFSEKDINLILPYLERAKLVIGFNTKGFDYPVLQPYLNFDLQSLNSLDIFEEARNSLGFRLSLNSIAEATLNVGKIGTGLDALKFFRQGEMEKLSQYCQHDVLLTRELYEFGKRNGHLIYRKGMGLETFPVSWAEGKTISQILHQAFDQRKILEIEYSSPRNNAGKRHLRKIDIYHFDFDRIVAYCHLREDLRTFKIRRILSAKLLEAAYEIPIDFNLQEFRSKNPF